MRKLTFLAVPISLVVCSCGTAPGCDDAAPGPVAPPCSLPYSISLESTYPTLDRTALEQAIEIWNTALRRDVFLLTRGEGEIVVRRGSRDEGSHVLASWAIFHCGECATGGIVWVMDEAKWCRPRLRRAFLHELGHALGLRHEDATSGSSVMDISTPACGTEDMHEEMDVLERAKELIDGTDR